MRCENRKKNGTKDQLLQKFKDEFILNMYKYVIKQTVGQFSLSK